LVKNPKELKMKITWNKNQFKSIGGFIGFSIRVDIPSQHIIKRKTQYKKGRQKA
jgi:hypothetical protein